MPRDLSGDDPRVLADDALLQRVADGAQPPTGDRVGDLMARWLTEIADIRAPDGAPATTRLPNFVYGDPGRNPIAFLPTDSGPEGRVDYEGHVDYAWPYGRHALIPEWSVMAEHAERRTFVGDDGETYERVPATEFESFDDVDSTSIVDPGAPE